MVEAADRISRDVAEAVERAVMAERESQEAAQRRRDREWSDAMICVMRQSGHSHHEISNRLATVGYTITADAVKVRWCRMQGMA